MSQNSLVVFSISLSVFLSLSAFFLYIFQLNISMAGIDIKIYTDSLERVSYIVCTLISSRLLVFPAFLFCTFSLLFFIFHCSGFYDEWKIQAVYRMDIVTGNHVACDAMVKGGGMSGNGSRRSALSSQFQATYFSQMKTGFPENAYTQVYDHMNHRISLSPPFSPPLSLSFSSCLNAHRKRSKSNLIRNHYYRYVSKPQFIPYMYGSLSRSLPNGCSFSAYMLSSSVSTRS